MTAQSRLIGIGSILLCFALVALTAIGAAIVLGVTPRPRIIGFPILISSVAVALWSMGYWARTLTGILGCATLNGSDHYKRTRAEPTVRSGRPFGGGLPDILYQFES
jgi:hypothetical protein